MNKETSVADEVAEIGQGQFDLESLRLSQDFASTVGVKKLLTTVPVRKPDRHWYVRTHSSEDYRIETAILEMKEDRETYLVAPGLWGELVGEITPKMLFTAVNRQGVVFIWAIRLPKEDGRLDDWNRSALDAAERAQNGWVSVRANMSLGAYEVFEATGDIPDPEWPTETFQKLMEIAFKGRFIEDTDHPVLRRLRGEL